MDNPPAEIRRILAIDVGGSHLKAAVLDSGGEMLTERARVKTPKPITRDNLMDGIVALVAPLGEYSCISVGFPGAVRDGIIKTAPNLSTEVLGGFDLVGALGERLGKPVRLVNDADMQGLAAVKGHGLEMVVTLGTGIGTSIFSNGKLCPHLELSHHPFRKGQDFDQQIGDAARKEVGPAKWNSRVQKAIKIWRTVVNFDRLYLGGGNTEHLEFALPQDIEIVSNENGIRGGAWLWREPSPML